MQKLLLIAVIVVSFTGTASSQTNYRSAEDVYKSRSLVFYGYDFNRVKLLEPKRMSEDMTTQVFEWIGHMKERITDERLKGWLSKEITSNWLPLVDYTKAHLKGKEVVDVVRRPIPQDSLESIIRDYPLTEKQGLGFVVILEAFEKDSKRVYAWFTFFDIASRKVVMADYFNSKEADGYGLTNYWGIGMKGTTQIYFADVFRPRAKKLGVKF